MSKLTPAHVQPEEQTPDALVSDLSQLIAEAQRHAAVVVNVGLTVLYWQVARRISQELLGGDRAAYGKRSPFGRPMAQSGLRAGFTRKSFGAWCSSPRRFGCGNCRHTVATILARLDQETLAQLKKETLHVVNYRCFKLRFRIAGSLLESQEFEHVGLLEQV